jgi:hypothetical protein
MTSHPGSVSNLTQGHKLLLFALLGSLYHILEMPTHNGLRPCVLITHFPRKAARLGSKECPSAKAPENNPLNSPTWSRLAGLGMLYGNHLQSRPFLAWDLTRKRFRSCYRFVKNQDHEVDQVARSPLSVMMTLWPLKVYWVAFFCRKKKERPKEWTRGGDTEEPSIWNGQTVMTLWPIRLYSPIKQILLHYVKGGCLLTELPNCVFGEFENLFE